MVWGVEGGGWGSFFAFCSKETLKWPCMEVLCGDVARTLQLIFRYILREVLRDLAWLIFRWLIFSMKYSNWTSNWKSNCMSIWTSNWMSIWTSDRTSNWVQLDVQLIVQWDVRLDVQQPLELGTYVTFYQEGEHIRGRMRNFDRTFTPRKRLRSARNCGKTRFRRSPIFHFSIPKKN